MTKLVVVSVPMQYAYVMQTSHHQLIAKALAGRAGTNRVMRCCDDGTQRTIAVASIH